jgi:acetyl esterase
MRRLLLVLLVAICAAGAAFWISPWPGVLIIRTIFDSGANSASAKLEPLVPVDVTTSTHNYDRGDIGAILDIYSPAVEEQKTPIVVWIHGGGFVSGRRQDIANYLKILAGRGFTVVNVDYTIAPEAKYPTPVRQVLTALTYLLQNRQTLGLSTDRFVLAGDSAGSQIAAQTAMTIFNSNYADTLGIKSDVMPNDIAGLTLFCGIYDIAGSGKSGGILGWFVHTTGWAYSGSRNWRESNTFATINLIPHIPTTLPPVFISAGNADPLGPQSVAMAQALEARGVEVESLFFPADHEPPLAHEYQFDLATTAARRALDGVVTWLNQL